jgi:hypothetical protein
MTNTSATYFKVSLSPGIFGLQEMGPYFPTRCSPNAMTSAGTFAFTSL